MFATRIDAIGERACSSQQEQAEAPAMRAGQRDLIVGTGHDQGQRQCGGEHILQPGPRVAGGSAGDARGHRSDALRCMFTQRLAHRLVDDGSGARATQQRRVGRGSFGLAMYGEIRICEHDA